MGPSRRTLLQGAAFLAGYGLTPAALRAQPVSGEGRAFSFASLLARAEAMARAPYQPPYRPMPDVVARIDYVEHGKLKFRPERALFSGETEGTHAAYPLEFFHLGQYFAKRVKMHVVEGGRAWEIPYDPTKFEMPSDSPAKALPPDAGYAGFRLQEWHEAEDWRTQDWVAFLGASYFRAIGGAGQYGLSARGVAIDAAVAGASEEFPDFTEFYIEEGLTPEAPVLVSALLDGPSLSGAFRFHLTRGLDRDAGVLMEVEASLFMRRAVSRLGLAPLTSMFWYGEYGRERMSDWRPEIHDSDGLALWTGSGERIWRPLNNPTATRISAFLDENPRGFGLLQRDRNFDHYLDGVMYDRRPCLWVEPVKPFGRGAVELLEIPTDDEIHDNIGAFWVPEAPVAPGQRHDLHYRLHWLNDEPYPAEIIARCIATRIGKGGQPGLPRPADVYRFAVEFDRPSVMTRIPYGVFPEVVVTASSGSVDRVFSEPVPNGNVWRANFDLALAPGLSSDLRLYMKLNDEPLTETWIYQFSPDLASFR